MLIPHQLASGLIIECYPHEFLYSQETQHKLFGKNTQLGTEILVSYKKTTDESGVMKKKQISFDEPARFELAYSDLQSDAWPGFATARQKTSNFHSNFSVQNLNET